MEDADLGTKLLEAQRQSLVDDTDDPAPCIEAVELLRPLEHRLGWSGQTSGQEAPDGRVEGLLLVQGHVAVHAVEGGAEHVLRDLGLVLALRPLEDLEESRHLGHEVALQLALPGYAVDLRAVEAVLSPVGELVVEELLVRGEEAERSNGLEHGAVGTWSSLLWLTSSREKRRTLTGWSSVVSCSSSSAVRTLLDEADTRVELLDVHAVAEAIAALGPRHIGRQSIAAAPGLPCWRWARRVVVSAAPLLACTGEAAVAGLARRRVEAGRLGRTRVCALKVRDALGLLLDHAVETLEDAVLVLLVERVDLGLHGVDALGVLRRDRRASDAVEARGGLLLEEVDVVREVLEGRHHRLPLAGALSIQRGDVLLDLRLVLLVPRDDALEAVDVLLDLGLVPLVPRDDVLEAVDVLLGLVEVGLDVGELGLHDGVTLPCLELELRHLRRAVVELLELVGVLTQQVQDVLDGLLDLPLEVGGVRACVDASVDCTRHLPPVHALGSPSAASAKLLRRPSPGTRSWAPRRQRRDVRDGLRGLGAAAPLSVGRRGGDVEELGVGFALVDGAGCSCSRRHGWEAQLCCCCRWIVIAIAPSYHV